MRMAIAERDDWTCQICGRPILSRDDLHIDHLLPRSRGGSDEPSNLRAAHKHCNLERGDRD